MEHINNFTYHELVALKYSKQVILDLANVLDYCEYMMRLTLINREKRFRALNKRTSIQYQNGMLTYRDAMTEQLRHYIKCGTDEEDFG